MPRRRRSVEQLSRGQDRQARTVLSELIVTGVLVSDTPKGPIRLGFPSTVIERWFPGLYQPRPAVADAKEITVPAIAADGERTAMAKELGSRVARRGWTAPYNFDEMIAIYADQGPSPPC